MDYFPFSDEEINNEFNFISQKLDVSENKLKLIMQEKNKSFKDYKSSYFIIQFFVKLLRMLNLESRLIR